MPRWRKRLVIVAAVTVVLAGLASPTSAISTRMGGATAATSN